MSYTRKTTKPYRQHKRRPPTTRLHSNITKTKTQNNVEMVTDIDALVERAKESAQKGEKWVPPVFDLCPTCKQKRKEEEKKQQPPRPPQEDEEPPENVEIEEQTSEESSGSGSSSDEGESEDSEEKEEGSEKKAEEKAASKPHEDNAGADEPQESQGEKGADSSTEPQDEPQEEGKEEEEGDDSSGGAGGGDEGDDDEEEDEDGDEEKEDEVEDPVSPDDIEKAKTGSSNVNNEFNQAQRTSSDVGTENFEPITAAADPQMYRDASFIAQMGAALKSWRQGFIKKTGASGSKLSVKEFIRSKGEEPFTSRIRKSAKGRKILVIADFSGSICSVEDEYKKAIVSSMEVLDGIGTKTALFAFGGQVNENQVQINVGGQQPVWVSPGNSQFFKVKQFEEPKWENKHAAKAAALTNQGLTPTAQIYRMLSRYIKRHRPDITLTLTDGAPDNRTATQDMVKELKRSTKMVAFGIGENYKDADNITTQLNETGYSKTLAVSSIKELPRKLVRLIAPK